MDWMIFFGSTEDMLNQEIKELKEQLQAQKNIINAKDAIIQDLQNENIALQNNINSLQTKVKKFEDNETSNIIPQESMNSFEMKSNDKTRDSMETSMANLLSQDLESMNEINFDSMPAMKTYGTRVGVPLGNMEEDIDFIPNPTATMEINDGTFKIRRSSLSEEEEQRMEMEAVQSVENVNNVIFNDSKVNNMNMNIINNHNHTHNNNNNKEQKIELLKKEIMRLNERMDDMMKSKMKLVMSTSKEMDSLRRIICKYAKVAKR